MIQFNLLPDVKTQFIKAQRIKRMAIAISVIVTGVSLLIFVLLFLYVDVSQKVHLNDLAKDITTNSAQLNNDSNLSKVLTIQNQLETLPKLDDQKPAVTRIGTYVTELTPTTISITELDVNFSTNTFSITGQAGSLTDVNQYIDAIKFATYQTSASSGSKNAFSTVVLASFGYSSKATSGSQAAAFNITFNFDPTIFDNSDNVTLTVPQQATTRSILGQPTALFVKPSTDTTGGGQ